jgi:predicted dithiol-disulfide oxidoreductase (DUF899 family)
MCPACFANVILLAIGATSTGGLSMLAMKNLFFKDNSKRANKQLETDEMKIETIEPKTDQSEINPAKVVSSNQWLVARKDLLTHEKELTRLRDEVSRHRRALPWIKIDKEYVFDGPNGKETLADLFGRCSQLIVYHFMFGPDWEEGCKSCSYLADHFDGANWHLPHRDVAFVAISRAPLSKLQAYKKRMDWRFKWLSSHGNDFNFDFHVSFTKEDEKKNKAYYNYAVGEFINDELPGLSVFYKDKNGAVFHTYSTYARGLDILVGTYNFLDLVPKGRDEDHLDFTMDWVRRHDEY